MKTDVNSKDLGNNDLHVRHELPVRGLLSIERKRHGHDIR
jgi:hypothetical protein